MDRTDRLVMLSWADPMIEIIYETHSTSVDNEAGVASGHIDTPLSVAGRGQAAEVGLRYKESCIRDVYCSDLQRSYRTAEIAFGARNDVRIHVDPRLRECNYGLWNGIDRSRVDADRANRIHTPFPQGESYTDCVRRLRGFLVDLWTESPSSPIVVVGHRATWYAFEHLMRGRSLREAIVESWAWQPGWRYTLYGPPADFAVDPLE